MKSATKRNLLLINGFGSPMSIIDELLSNSPTDSNLYLSYPLGILTLASWCRQDLPNFGLQVLDGAMELHKRISRPDRRPVRFDEFVGKLLDQVDFVPDYVGVSINFSNGHRACLRLCRLCKERWPKARVIAGGVHATTFTRDLIADPHIDCVIRGAGDIAFVDLLAGLAEDREVDGIPGVATGPGNLSSAAPPLADLDAVPPYPYDLIDVEYLVVNESTNPLPGEGARTGTIFMSRGCPFGCAFCAADQVHGKKVRFKSVGRMVDEVEHLIRVYRTNTICIVDDLFGVDRGYFREFFRRCDERGLRFRLAVPGGLSIAVFQEDMIDVLVEHGLRAVYFPLESGSKHVQEAIIGKRVDLEKAVRLIRYAKHRGLFVGINIVLGSPGETREMMYETREFIRRLPVDWVAFFAAYPYPETRMTRTLLERGVLTEADLVEIWDSSTQGFKERPFDTEEISGRELAELISDFNIELNFFDNYNFRTGQCGALLGRLDKIVSRYPFHIVALACRARCCWELDRREEAERDLERISLLVRENPESRKLLARYGDQIRETVGACGEGRDLRLP